MNESKTPRTDAIDSVTFHSYQTHYGLLLSLARQIEADLTDSKAKEDKLAEALADISGESQNYQCRGDERDHQTFESCISTAEQALAEWRAAK